MELYGTTSEQLGHVGMTFRRHASMNPDAVMRKPYTIEEHQASRYIAEPLRLLDYCLINDGAVATDHDDRGPGKRHGEAASLHQRICPRRHLCATSSFYTPPDDLWYDALQDIAGRVYGAAGIERDGVDGLMIYDNFTPTVLFSLEGMGFCPRGEGGSFVADGNLALGRPLAHQHQWRALIGKLYAGLGVDRGGRSASASRVRRATNS